MRNLTVPCAQQLLLWGYHPNFGEVVRRKLALAVCKNFESVALGHVFSILKRFVVPEFRDLDAGAHQSAE